MPDVCKDVFSKRPCLGIWRQSCNLTHDALSRLTFTDSPVLRYKAMDCEEWVGDEDSDITHDPAMCVKCGDAVAMTSEANRESKPNPKYEEEEEQIVKVKEEISLMDFVDSNTGNLDSEGGEEEDEEYYSEGLADAEAEVMEDNLNEDTFATVGLEDKCLPDDRPPKTYNQLIEEALSQASAGTIIIDLNRIIEYLATSD